MDIQGIRMKIMADEKSILDGGLIEINPNAGFDDLMKAWPKESLYWKEEPPLSPESLAIVEDGYRKALIRGRGFGKEKAQERLRKQLEDLRRDDLKACDLTEEDVKEYFTRPIVLARGHHIRNADGTI